MFRKNHTCSGEEDSTSVKRESLESMDARCSCMVRMWTRWEPWRLGPVPYWSVANWSKAKMKTSKQHSRMDKVSAWKRAKAAVSCISLMSSASFLCFVSSLFKACKQIHCLLHRRLLKKSGWPVPVFRTVQTFFPHPQPVAAWLSYKYNSVML